MSEGRVGRVVLKGVTKRFGATTVLRGVDGVLEAGGTVVTGANGAGKSTLLSLMGLLSKPTSGEIRVETAGGRELTHEEIRRELGWVSHESLCYGDLSGRQNVEMAAAFRGLDTAVEWQRLSERFGLGKFSERPVRTHSRGQRQRIALARALVGSPSLLLLDEPTTGLDEAALKVLLDTVEGEVRGGAVVVVVAHDADLFRGRLKSELRIERGKVDHSAFDN